MKRSNKQQLKTRGKYTEAVRYKQTAGETRSNGNQVWNGKEIQQNKTGGELTKGQEVTWWPKGKPEHRKTQNIKYVNHDSCS